MIDLNTLQVHLQQMGLKITWVRSILASGSPYEVLLVHIARSVGYPIGLKILNDPSADTEELLKFIKDYIVSISMDKG